MSIREQFQTKIEQQLSSWESQLTDLRSNAGERVNTNYETALAEWKVAVAKVHELRAATGDRWTIIKKELERTYHAIAVALGSAPTVDRDVSTRITERGMAAVVPDGEEKPA